MSVPPASAGVLATTLAGVALRNPVILAAGCAGTLHEFDEVLDLSRVGAVVTKSITPLPREGNPTWRILPTRTGVGMLNAIGLANPGIDAFEREYLPRAGEGGGGGAMPCPIIGSVAGFSVEDYAAVAASFAQARGLAAIELNLSCPNVKHGTEFGASPPAAAEVVRAVRAVAPGTPLFIKLSPVAPDIATIARAVVEAGGERTGLTIGNTIPALAIDVETRRPLLANVTGGLSGPAIHAAAVRSVWEVFNRFGRDLHGPGKHMPIIGLGGVVGWRDAAEFILAGATAVGMGTALYADPRSPLGVVRGLDRWVRRQGASSLSELVGTLRPE
ncbi:MAG: dihydroorotate dehydrogenase [Phycisphaerales bacterium]|nr:dihydroorotate dehydrogenase [Phycisphaerales bacterium]